MSNLLRIGLAQVNPTVGDIVGNTALIKDVSKQQSQADLVVFPELVLSGYPPEDLVLRPRFIQEIDNALLDLAQSTRTGAALLLGAPWHEAGKIYNAAVLMQDGKMQAVTAKHHLPNYGVFDEQRVFTAGRLPQPLDFAGSKLGVMICEDMWQADVAKHLLEQGAEMLIVLNGSPFEIGKSEQRLNVAAARARETNLPLLYVNMVGGQDELVFDGRSFALQPTGQPLLHMAAWHPAVHTTEWSQSQHAVAV